MPKFQPGQCGNPEGRPNESFRAKQLRLMISAHAPAIIKVVVAAALEGDLQAAKILLERAVPPMKATNPDPALNLPNRRSLTASAQDIFRLMNAGDLSVDAGSELLNALGLLAKIQAVDELERRVAELEKK